MDEKPTAFLILDFVLRILSVGFHPKLLTILLILIINLKLYILINNLHIL